MRTASSPRYAENWVITIVLATFLFLTSAVGFTVIRALILLGDLSSLAAPNGAECVHPAQIQP